MPDDRPTRPALPARHRFRRGWLAPTALSVLLLLVAGCGDRESLIHVPTEKEANRLLVELAARQVTGARAEAKAEQRRTQWLVTVPQRDVARARQILVDLNLPKDAKGGYEQMLSSTSLIPTAADEAARKVHAVCGELERTLETYDGVSEARVHVVFPDRPVLPRAIAVPATSPAAAAPAGPSAMVLIKHAADRKPGADGAVPRVEDVRQMVARSVEGMRDADVVVHFTAAAHRELPPPVEPTPLGDPMVQLLAGTAALGLLCVCLLVLLVRERRGRRGLAVVPAVPVA